MTFNKRLFAILWLPGMAGVLSLLLVDVSELLAHLPLPPGTEMPAMTPALKLLSVVQPAVLMSVAVLIGVALASRVGLRSPLAEAAAAGGRLSSALAPQILPGTCGGVAGGLAVVFTAALFKPFLPPEVIPRIAALGHLLPLATRLLYGGIIEELLLRWGFMTLLVWAAWRLFQRGEDKPKPACYVGAILVSSVVFGLGHLPIAFLLLPEPTLAYVLYVILANSLFGLVAGFLYWKQGLESAMIAHMLAHVVMLAANRLGVFF